MKKVLFILLKDSFSFFREHSILYAVEEFRKRGFSPEVLRVEPKWSRSKSGFGQYSITYDLFCRIRAMDPDLIVGWENGGCLWSLNLQADEGLVNAVNLLQKPAIFMWDNTLTQAVNFLGDNFEEVKAVLTAPNALHFSHDRGDTAHAGKIFGAGKMKVRFQLHNTAGLFYGLQQKEEDFFAYDVSHCGNIYVDYLTKNTPPFSGDAGLSEAVESAQAEKYSNLQKPIFDIYRESLEKAGSTLAPDSPFFWEAYNYLLLAANTGIRLKMFEAVRQRLDFFGCYSDPGSGDYLSSRDNISFHSPVAYGAPISEVYKTSKINLIIGNMINQDGISPKLVDCLLSGGFALVDPRPELYSFFGPEVDRIIYRSAGELNEKIAYFLDRAEERRELVHVLSGRIRTAMGSEGGIFDSYLSAINEFHQGRRSFRDCIEAA